MQPGLLPLFPLHVVVFPRTLLPLHIFEDKYKEMVGEAIRDGTEFGIVLARDKGILNAGCTVAVEKVLKRYDDGRLDILSGGRRRFEILSLDQEKDYLRGSVQFFDDDDTDPVPPDLRARVLERYKVVLELRESEPAPEPALEDRQLSFQLAQVVDDLDFRHTLLRLRSEPERMQRLVEFFDRELPKLRVAEHMRRIAPLNGHSRLPFKPGDIQ
jgi:Lon protease-like protein